MTGCDSENIDIVIRSYDTLSSLANSYAQVNIGSLTPTALKVYDRLASSPERALSVICKSTRILYRQDASTVVGACQLLAGLIER